MIRRISRLRELYVSRLGAVSGWLPVGPVCRRWVVATSQLSSNPDATPTAREQARRVARRPIAGTGPGERAACPAGQVEEARQAVRAVLPDLACFLEPWRGKIDWAAVHVHDVEAFLQTRPASRKRRLTALGHFSR